MKTTVPQITVAVANVPNRKKKGLHRSPFSRIRILAVSILLWCGTVGFPKKADEMAYVVEAAIQRDLGDRHIGGAERVLGLG